MKILITGINGFVGKNFVDVFKHQHILYGLDIISPIQEGVEHTFSWNELDKIPQVDVIVHLAGKAHDTKNQSLAEIYFEINTELTKKIFDYFLLSKTKKFIFFSSVKAAADTTHNTILTEDVVPNPVGPYAESKIRAEQYIESKKEEYINSNKNVFILRPCMIHGAGNKGNLNLLYNSVKNGLPWPLGAYDNLRSFCSIKNISFVVEQLIESEIESGTYNVCDDEVISTNKLIQLIAESVYKKPIIIRFPKILVNTLASVGDFLHFPLNKERLNKLTENYIVSNDKIKKALKIERMKVSAIEGMKQTLNSFNLK